LKNSFKPLKYCNNSDFLTEEEEDAWLILNIINAIAIQ
jgi:hypothetical protein